MQIQQLPFVKGIPDDGQKRITFIKNGEQLIGSETKYGYSGNLNAASSELQENIVICDHNIKLLAGASDATNVEVEKIKELISDSGSLELIEKVEKNSEDIASLKAENVVNVNDIKTLKLENKKIVENLGTKPAGDNVRDVYADLTYVKTKIGNSAGFDINGNPVVGIPSSGLTKRLEDTTAQVLVNKTDIKKIQDSLEQTDLVVLDEQVKELRTELGPKAIDGEKTIKTRLDEVETKVTTNSSEISKINQSIGSVSVVDEIASMKQEHQELDELINDPTTGLIKKVETNTTAIGDVSSGLVKSTIDNKKSIDDIDKQLKDPTTGLIKQVSDLKTFTGIGQADPQQDSLAGKIKVLTALTNDNSSTIQDIQVELGNASSGLIFDVAQMKIQLADHKTRIGALETKYTALELRVAALEP